MAVLVDPTKAYRCSRCLSGFEYSADDHHTTQCAVCDSYRSCYLSWKNDPPLSTEDRLRKQGYINGYRCETCVINGGYYARLAPNDFGVCRECGTEAISLRPILVSKGDARHEDGSFQYPKTHKYTKNDTTKEEDTTMQKSHVNFVIETQRAMNGYRSQISLVHSLVLPDPQDDTKTIQPEPVVVFESDVRTTDAQAADDAVEHLVKAFDHEFDA